jgi:hypothetical protein
VIESERGSDLLDESERGPGPLLPEMEMVTGETETGMIDGKFDSRSKNVSDRMADEIEAVHEMIVDLLLLRLTRVTTSTLVVWPSLSMFPCSRRCSARSER